MAKIPDGAALSRDMGNEFRPYALANWGPIVWYMNTSEWKLIRLDLRDGTSESAVDLGKRGSVFSFDTDGNELVWFQDLTGGPDIRWQVRSQDLATGAARTIDEGLWAGRADSVVAVDGDLVAYSLGDPRPGDRNGSQIIVGRLSTGEVVRRIASDLAIFDLAISDGNLVFSAGRFTSNPYDQVFDTELFLSTDENPEPCFIVDGAYDVAAQGDQLVWVAKSYGGLVRATVSEIEQDGGCRAPNALAIELADFPSEGDDLFAWSGYGLDLWNPATDDVRTLADAYGSTAQAFGPILSSIGGGWLAWASHVEQDGRDMWPLNAAPLVAVRQAMGN